MSRILVVDDTPIQLKILISIMRNQGFDIVVASSGPEALESVQSQKPDLILLDIVMSDMDGYEVCKRLKNNPEHADIPILFLTGKNDSDDIVKAFDAGAADYATKPVNPTELVARVKTHLRLGSSIAELKEALEEVKLLSGLLRICSYCKNIQHEESWVALEDYLAINSDARLTHSICPGCMEQYIK